MKSRDAGGVEDSAATVYAALAGADDFLTNGPEEVVKAVGTLQGFLEEVLTDEPKRDSIVEKMRKFFSREEEVVKSEDDAEVQAEVETAPEAEAPEVETPEAETEVVKMDEDLPELDFEFDDLAEDEGEVFVKASDLETALAPLRDVMGAMLDRFENIEKSLAGSSQEFGQEVRSEEEVTKSSGGTIGDAIRSAARGNRVTIK
jgi:hypothetical protein